MSFALQLFAVALLVSVCALYSTWRLMSVRLRLRSLELLGGVPGLARAAWLAALRARLVTGAGACGGCAPPSAASRKQTPGALRR
ncbi:MAG TPA: hypothetical protein VH109_00525 [Steroidobacteraceae bacterium]|nr:hypothetical protein [Steroidobacteraceae bacterium]